MAFVIQTDAADADAYVLVDLGSPQTEVWPSAEVYFDPASLAALIASGVVNLIECYLADGATFTGSAGVSGGTWAANATSGADAPDGATWTPIEFQVVNDAFTFGPFYVDAVQEGSGHNLNGDTQIVRIGQSNSLHTTPGLLYLRNLKLGTTRGDDDLFSWPESEGSAPAGASLVGAATVIGDPTVTSLAVSTAPGLVPSTFTTRRTITT